MNNENFEPVLRFTVVSDVHYKDEHSVERERMADAIATSYKLAENEKYNRVDALYVVGDFADKGTLTQMEAFKETLDEGIKGDTLVNLSLASHEFNFNGVEGAYERFGKVFSQEADTHKVINGFHFISVSCSDRCEYDDSKRAFVRKALDEATADTPKKPIFFFQHPHIADTVYGSINWGDDDLNDILCDYPQIIDFSGHSHAPINDPRSIHQRHFTCVGTGTLSYFEGDDFDKVYGTLFPGKEKAAQMTIVEADKDGRVRIYPYDLITHNFFPFVWKIDTPWDPMSFTYTDERYKSTLTPYFGEDAKAVITEETADGFTVRFDQAKIDDEYVCAYRVYVKNSDGVIIRCSNVWSEYYFYDMPENLSVSFTGLKSGDYYAEIVAESFWAVKSSNILKSKKISI